MQHFPTVEQAYAHVRRKVVRQSIMTTSGDSGNIHGAVLASKSLTHKSNSSSHSGHLSLMGGKSYGISNKQINNSGGEKCSHCGNAKHACDNCFKLHGYPDWWHDL